MPPYNGIIAAGLRRNRRYNRNYDMVPRHYKNPVKRSEGLPTQMFVRGPSQEMVLSAGTLSSNLPGIHHQAREMGNRRIDLMETFGNRFEFLDDPESLSEVTQWVYACISGLEQMDYSHDPFGFRIGLPLNPFGALLDVAEQAKAVGDYNREHENAEHLIHLFQAVGDFLLEDRRSAPIDGILLEEFFNTAFHLAPYISEVLGGAGMLLLLRAVATMSGHDELITRGLIQRIPGHEQSDLLRWAFLHLNGDNAILGFQIVKILR